MMRAALEAFVKAYESQDSFTAGLDRAYDLAKAALAVTPAVGGEAKPWIDAEEGDS